MAMHFGIYHDGLSKHPDKDELRIISDVETLEDLILELQTIVHIARRKPKQQYVESLFNCKIFNGWIRINCMGEVERRNEDK